MARFKYLGEPAYSFVDVIGQTTQIKIKKQDGTTVTLTGPPGGFVIGADIGANITDERALRTIRADIRFEEI